MPSNASLYPALRRVPQNHCGNLAARKKIPTNDDCHETPVTLSPGRTGLAWATVARSPAMATPGGSSIPRRVCCTTELVATIPRSEESSVKTRSASAAASMKTRWTHTQRVATGLTLSLVTVACTSRSVKGEIVAADGRVGVPCVLEMRDHRYKDHRILALMKATTGHETVGEFELQPPNTVSRPISDTQEITIRCEGYVPVERSFTPRQLWWGAPLGRVIVQPSGR